LKAFHKSIGAVGRIVKITDLSSLSRNFNRFEHGLYQSYVFPNNCFFFLHINASYVTYFILFCVNFETRLEEACPSIIMGEMKGAYRVSGGET
jgi:hypothetical protein